MAEALEIIGKKMTVEDIMHEIRQDDVFYRQSNGGVTLSGGEATLQYDFLLELLRALKCEGYHVVLETSGQVAGERLEMLANLVDIFYFDIKGLHPGLHKLHTGIDNTVIWANIRLLTAAGKRIVFRIPVIPGYTDDADQVRLLDAFISGLGTRPEPVEIQLLPFHAFGEDKLETIHTTQKKLGLLPGSAGRLDEIQSLLQKPGRTVVIGGR
jgi:pyruvate formate lyase activating enzyme